MVQNLKCTEVSKEIWEREKILGCSIFLNPDWLISMSSSRDEIIYLVFVSHNNKVVAKVSGLLEKTSFSCYKQLFCYAGPALHETSQELNDNVHSSLYTYCKGHKICRIILGSYDQQHGFSVGNNRFHSSPRSEYIIDLRNGLEGISFHKSFLKKVRKVERMGGLTARTKDSKLYFGLLHLLNETKKTRLNKYGVKYNPFHLKRMNSDSILKALQNNLGQLYYYSISNDDRINSAQFNLEYINKAYGLLAASDEIAYKKGLSVYNHYKVIKELAEKDYDYYNIGGSTKGEGSDSLDYYKVSMGAVRQVVYSSNTNFILFPLNLLNPFINIIRRFKNKVNK